MTDSVTSAEHVPFNLPDLLMVTMHCNWIHEQQSRWSLLSCFKFNELKQLLQ